MTIHEKKQLIKKAGFNLISSGYEKENNLFIGTVSCLAWKLHTKEKRCCPELAIDDANMLLIDILESCNV